MGATLSYTMFLSDTVRRPMSLSVVSDLALIIMSGLILLTALQYLDLPLLFERL